VEIPHGRVKSRFLDNASDFQIYIGFPDLHKPEFPHGHVEIPHGRVEARFIVYLRPILGFQRYTFAEALRGFAPTPRGLRLGFQRGFWRLWRIVTTHTKGVL